MISLDDLLADLADLVNVESPSHDVDALDRCAAVLADIIERRLGTRPELIATSAGPIVHWRADVASRVLILGHHDTVFPIGTLARRPFTVADGRATGPGVFDMKAGIVQSVHAVASLDDRSGIEILMTPDEEVGSEASRALLEARAQACGTVLVLEPSADGGALKTARKGVGTFEVVVHGRASHAGLEPEKGINSLVAAAELIGTIATLGDPALATTVTPTMAMSGTAENVVPAETRVRVDVRIEEPAEHQRLDKAMADLAAAGTSVAGATVEILGGINRPPMHSSASSTLFPVAVDAAAAAGIADVRGVGVGGGSDGNFTAALGIPTLDGLGAVGGGAHADHEFIEVATMVERATMLAELIRRL
jgi:glutamate carboxypeptidase